MYTNERQVYSSNTPDDPGGLSFYKFYCYHYQIITGWWLGHPSEKYEFVSWDDDRNPIYAKIKLMATKPPTRLCPPLVGQMREFISMGFSMSMDLAKPFLRNCGLYSQVESPLSFSSYS